MNIHWVSDVGEDWEEAYAELERAFRMSREAAQAGESWVYVVNSQDLLGRRGAANAMVATGLLSAARTAAIEGWPKGWRANVVAWNGEPTDRVVAESWALQLLQSEGVTGELIHVGPGHIGKALA